MTTENVACTRCGWQYNFEANRHCPLCLETIFEEARGDAPSLIECALRLTERLQFQVSALQTYLKAAKDQPSLLGLPLDAANKAAQTAEQVSSAIHAEVQDQVAAEKAAAAAAAAMENEGGPTH